MPRSIPYIATVALALLAVPVCSAAATKFSWFDDENSPRDSLGFPRSPAALGPEAHLRFAPDTYRLKPGMDDDRNARTGDVLKIYGDPRAAGARAPLAGLNRAAGEEPLLLRPSDNRLSSFGVKWQHRVDAGNTVALSAGYNEFAWSVNPNQNLDMLDTRAALSWTNTWAGSWRPGVTSSVFVGDESTRDEAYQRLGRRYYGFSVGGQMTFQDHTPYVSYRLRRNLYSGADDPMYLLSPYDEHALVSAGWKWQVHQNWSLQAEASYGLNGQNVDLYAPDRSRFFFGTRYDFR